jgi:uncharacterized protein YecE (DUF72 family)
VYFLRQVPDWIRVAVEFRHPSWHDEAVFALLADHRAAYCVNGRIRTTRTSSSYATRTAMSSASSTTRATRFGREAGACSGDSDAAGLFRKAQADSRKGAEMGKQLLRSRLAS